MHEHSIMYYLCIQYAPSIEWLLARLSTSFIRLAKIVTVKLNQISVGYYDDVKNEEYSIVELICDLLFFLHMQHMLNTFQTVRAAHVNLLGQHMSSCENEGAAHVKWVKR